MTSSGALIENGKKVLEFVAIQRKDNQEWAIPGVRIFTDIDVIEVTNLPACIFQPYRDLSG